MIFRIFSVHDSKAEAFMTPFFMPKTAQAQRIFEQMVRDETHQFSRAPHDYTLFEIGMFDDEDGGVDRSVPMSVINGAQVRQGDYIDGAQAFGDETPVQ